MKEPFCVFNFDISIRSHSMGFGLYWQPAIVFLRWWIKLIHSFIFTFLNLVIASTV